MPHLRHARVLSLSGTEHGEVTNEPFSAYDFTGFNRLEELSVQGLAGGVLSGALAHTPRLRKLTMRFGQFSLDDLLHLHELETLTIGPWYSGEQPGVGLDLDGARALATLPLLRRGLKSITVHSPARRAWLDAFTAALAAACVPGSGVTITTRILNGMIEYVVVREEGQ